MFYFRNTDKSATVQCIQYLLLQHMKSKNLIKKDDLMKTFFKGRISGKNYDRVMNDVENTLNNVLLKYFVFYIKLIIIF